MAEFIKFHTAYENTHNDSQEYNALRRQHNIVCLIGNGFDTAILLRDDFKGLVGLDGKTTSYFDFYIYLSNVTKHGSKMIDEGNLIYAKMCEDIEKTDDEDEKKKWANFEKIVEDLVFNKEREDIKDFLTRHPHPEEDDAYIDTISADLERIANYFSGYLNELLPVDLIVEINKIAKKYQWASTSLSQFLGDLCEKDYKKMYFRYEYLDFDKDPEYQSLTDDTAKKKYRAEKRIKYNNTYNYDLYNYMIFNFNYSTLLDNYIYLDKNQFDPHKSKNPEVDRNFDFRIDPKGYIERHFKNQDGEIKDNEIEWSSYLLTEIIHPHGIKDIPRSFLFGTEKEITNTADRKNQFIKSFWGQNEKRYSRCIEDAELFIIYGMSLEKCDGWWYEKIYQQLSKKYSTAELIIYCYRNNNDARIHAMSDDEFRQDVKERFMKGRTLHGDKEDITENEKEVMGRIYVVPFTTNDTNFLGFKTDQEDEK